MGTVNNARKELLAKQLESAVVEPHPELADEGYYQVFVPGGVREFNAVQAESEAEAIEKVKANLESKIDQMAEEAPSSNVEVSPDNVEVAPGVDNG